jgi:sulfur-carrier protein adenylyltransferase/sulfurtransferase
MNELNNSPLQNYLTQKELHRYKSQISIPQIGQEGQVLIKKAKVIVIGSGSKGTTILQYLSALGIGKLGICDNSFIQEHELSTQLLFGNSDLGKQKAITAKQKLQNINHLVQFELHNVILNDNNINTICNNYDIIIDATDNFEAHFLINDSAIKNNKPFVFGCISGLSALVSVFNYLGGPSLRCLYSQEPILNNESLNIDYLCKASLYGIISAVIANEVIKIILGLYTNLNGNLLIYQPDIYIIKLKKITKNPLNFSS